MIWIMPEVYGHSVPQPRLVLHSEKAFEMFLIRPYEELMIRDSRLFSLIVDIRRSQSHPTLK